MMLLSLEVGVFIRADFQPVTRPREFANDNIERSGFPGITNPNSGLA